MKIELNFNKKQMIAVLVFVGLLIALGATVAYESTGTGGNPAVMGHSVDEIDWSKTINSNININGNMNSTKDFCINGGNCLSSVLVGGSHTLTCENKHTAISAKNTYSFLSCDAGYTLTGDSVMCETSGGAPVAGVTYVDDTTQAEGACANTYSGDALYITCCKLS